MVMFKEQIRDCFSLPLKKQVKIAGLILHRPAEVKLIEGGKWNTTRYNICCEYQSILIQRVNE